MMEHNMIFDVNKKYEDYNKWKGYRNDNIMCRNDGLFGICHEKAFCIKRNLLTC